MRKSKLLYEPLGPRYGRFGGTYVPELLVAPLRELEQQGLTLLADRSFRDALLAELQHYGGRPTPLTSIDRFAHAIDGPKLILKREDLLHTGAHKLNNAFGQCLLAKKMGKRRVLAETGAGQHGVATATACARLGLECTVYMGATDMERQRPNVLRMELLGAQVKAAKSGAATLKEAINEAMRDWAATFDDTFYCLGSALGPHPYPLIVRTFQSVIGCEAKEQMVAQYGQLPKTLIACIGGGSNAIGLFAPFLDDPVRMIGVEAGGRGIASGEHAARFAGGSPGVLHGCYSYLLQNQEGQIGQTHSISAGLDYPSIGPEHAHLHETGRAEYCSVTDQQALEAFHLLAKTEGIIPALESAHALAGIMQFRDQFAKDDLVLINLSGRGDKDL